MASSVVKTKKNPKSREKGNFSENFKISMVEVSSGTSFNEESNLSISVRTRVL